MFSQDDFLKREVKESESLIGIQRQNSDSFFDSDIKDRQSAPRLLLRVILLFFHSVYDAVSCFLTMGIFLTRLSIQIDRLYQEGIVIENRNVIFGVEVK